MTNVSCESKNSATDLTKIVGMLPYPEEQSFRNSFKYRAICLNDTVCNWNPFFFRKRLDQILEFIFAVGFACD